MRTAQFNMLSDPVFPVVTRSGARRWMRFVDLLDENDDFATGFDWPRGDLNVASYELAIGLLGLVHRPATPDDWRAIWAGKGKADVPARIAHLAPAFALFGDETGAGPRFCQDFEALSGEPNAIEALFIDTPGVNGQKKNADLMTHRGRFPALGLRAAAMALYALQQFAPSGGAGNRTGMRGGGPMTTLVLLRRGDGGTEAEAPLARVLLANLPLVCEREWLGDEGLQRALPWLAPTPTSEGKEPRIVSEASPEAHPLQAFFGMPRRIRLVAEGEGRCPISGEIEPLVTGFVQKPWGINYGVWRHPLTPYRQTKEDAPYSVKPKPGRFGYRDWVGVTVARTDGADKTFPADAIRAADGRVRELRRFSTALLAAGWAMNNMEAERFLDVVQPFYLTPDDPLRAGEIMGLARSHASAADAVVRLLRGALNDALFDGQAKSTDSGVFMEASEAFYERTEDAFHAGLVAVIEGDAETGPEAARRWLAVLRREALDLYDEHVTTLLGERLDAGFAERATTTFGRLVASLSDKGKLAREMGVPQPSESDGAASGKRKDREGAAR